MVTKKKSHFPYLTKQNFYYSTLVKQLPCHQVDYFTEHSRLPHLAQEK